MSTQTTAFNPATDNPSDPAGTLLPPTASHAAKSLSLFISGKPLLSDRTLALYTRVIREGMDNQSYTPSEWNQALGLDAENPLGDVVMRTLENRVSDNDAVLESSKTLETQLKEKFGAEGRGLHEYTSNVEDELPDNLVKTLRWIATRRNGIVHGDEDGFQDTQERARYVLQAARSWDWLANYEKKITTIKHATTSNGWGNKENKLDTKLINIGVIVFFVCIIMFGTALKGFGRVALGVAVLMVFAYVILNFTYKNLSKNK